MRQEHTMDLCRRCAAVEFTLFSQVYADNFCRVECLLGQACLWLCPLMWLRKL